MNTYVNLKVFNKDKLRLTGGLKKNFFLIYININICVNLLILLNLFLFKGKTIALLFGNLIVTNFNVSVIFFIFLINLNLLFCYKNLILQKINYSNDFFFAILNLNLFLPFIFLSNNIFNFIFFLELLGILVFFKLVVSKNNSVEFFKKKKNFFFSKKFINMIFYQF
jgi:hypothetical protein